MTTETHSRRGFLFEAAVAKVVVLGGSLGADGLVCQKRSGGDDRRSFSPPELASDHGWHSVTLLREEWD